MVGHAPGDAPRLASVSGFSRAIVKSALFGRVLPRASTRFIMKPLILADNAGVRFGDEIVERWLSANDSGAPCSASIVQALLYDRPFSIRCQNKTIGGRSESRRQLALSTVRLAGSRAPMLRRRIRDGSAMSSAIPAACCAKICRGRRICRRRARLLARFDPALQRAHDGCRDARRVPVHAHHRAQRLEPKGIAQSRQESRGTVIINDRLGDRSAEL